MGRNTNGQSAVPLSGSPSARKLRNQERAKRLLDALARLLPRPKPNPGQAVRRIGVLLQWGIGDAVLATPLLRGLRAGFPEASIELIGKAWLDQLFEGEDLHDATVLLEPPWTRYQGKYRVWRPEWRRYAAQLWRARAVPYDLLIAPRFDAREVAQLSLLRANRTAGFRAAGGAAWISDDIGLTRGEHDSQHRSEIAVRIADRLTGRSITSVPKLRADLGRQEAMRRRIYPDGIESGLTLAIHNGAGNAVRCWGWSRLRQVLRQLPPMVGRVVLLDDGTGLPSDPLDLPEGIRLLSIRCNLEDAKALFSLCDALLCSDNGIMHVAAAVGCPVVAVFGPTSRLWFGPAGPVHQVVLVEPMPCRPCLDACIYSTPRCLDLVPVEAVCLALQTVLTAVQGVRLPRFESTPARTRGGRLDTASP